MLDILEPTERYRHFWRFAAERQDIFFRRLRGEPEPWTTDEVMQEYRFTNVYRAADRTSQYLIRDILYGGDAANTHPEDILFRVLLFKLFNRIETWELLKTGLGHIPSVGSFRRQPEDYDKIITEATDPIYSAAYMMTGVKVYGHDRKHRNHLALLDEIIKEGLALKLMQCNSLEMVYRSLRVYPYMSDFTAYQYTIDLNYSPMLNFDENDFVVAGIGALDGIQNLFHRWDKVKPDELIRWFTEHQEDLMLAAGVFEFQTLWGRELHLIDVQNLFCEISKYLRGIKEYSGIRAGRMKRKFTPHPEPFGYYFPPKWQLNGFVLRWINEEMQEHGD